MKWKPDFSHAFENRPRSVDRAVILAQGGMGRVLQTAMLTSADQIVGQSESRAGGVVDLTRDTGRNDTESDYEPKVPRNFRTCLIPSINPSQIAREQRDNAAYLHVWAACDVSTMAGIDLDSADIGGSAIPGVTRLAGLVYPDRMDSFATEVVNMATSLGGSSASGRLWVLSFASPNGAVGSCILHTLRVIRTKLMNLRIPRIQEVAFVHFSLLLADQGRVTGRSQAAALQYAFLKEIDARCSRTGGSRD